MATKKQLGIGSLSLLFAVLAILWSCNFAWWDGLCVGDAVLNFLGLPAWTSGHSRIHLTVFYSIVLLIPGLIIGHRNQKDRFAAAGKWICLVMAVYIFIFPFFMVIG